MDRSSGKLIVVEGIDGSGKSTQVSLLYSWLQNQGCKVFFSEWNSSELVKPITKRGKKRQSLVPSTFALVHSTDFADRFERKILPLLHAGYIVLCDRYVYTAWARDSARGCPEEWVRALYSFARKPDLAFFFDVPLEVALRRILDSRPSLKYYEAGMDMELHSEITESFKIYQGDLYKRYQSMKEEGLFFCIDATLPPQEQQAIVRERFLKICTIDDFKLELK